MLFRRDKWRIQTKRTLWACVALFALGNILLGPLMTLIRPEASSAVLVIILFGSVAAQFGLSAIWYVFSPLRPARRLLLGALGATVLLVAWVLGLAFHSTSQSAGEAEWAFLVVILLCMPLMAIAAQTPLWGARCFLRWRVFHRRDRARRLPYESMGIRDIFFATGAVAVALSAARMGLMAMDQSTDSAWLPLAIWALGVAAVSLFTILPVVAATLRARRLWLALSTTWSIAVTITFAVNWLAFRRFGVPWREWINLVALAAGFITCLTGPLLLLRRLGYRLYWGRRGGGRAPNR